MVLAPASYDARHIPTAKSVPVGDPDFMQKAQALIPNKETNAVAYCSSAQCGASPLAAGFISHNRYTQNQTGYMARAFQTITSATVLLGLLSIFSLCLTTFSIMTMDDVGQMTDCGLVHTATICPVSMAEHLRFWQQIFVPASPMVLLLALVIVVAAFLVRRIIDPLHIGITRLTYNRWQLLYEPTLLLSDYLKQAFSQGVLHPKIY